MERIDGKCPQCGEITKVIPERETCFCSKCRAQINVQESIRLLQKAGDTPPTVGNQPVRAEIRTSTAKRREERERQADAKARATDVAQRINDMFQLCSSEQDFLMLRSQILNMNIAENEKAELLSALDAATKQRLQTTFDLAAQYAEANESPASLILGCIVIIATGLAINYFFTMKWPGIIAGVLVALALLGKLMAKGDKRKMEECKKAVELLQKYREAGYKI